MKVIVGDKVYLQKFDLAFMFYEFSVVPGPVMAEAFSSACIVSVNGGDDAVKFGFCFEDEEAVEFLKECDWILDYSVYSKKDIEELIALHGELSSKLSREVDAFNAASVDYRKKNFDEYSVKFDHMKLKAMSLDMLIDCKKGMLPLPEMPDENTVLVCNGFDRLGDAEFYRPVIGIRIETVKAPKKQGFFRRLFKRGAQ